MNNCPTCGAKVTQHNTEYGPMFTSKEQDIEIAIKRLDNFVGLPAYASENAACMDLLAAITEPMDFHGGSTIMVPTGVAMQIPVGYEGQVRPRSGLAAKQGITVLNSPGTIDADYTGEIKVILHNASNESTYIEPGQRVAQFKVAPQPKITFKEVDTFEDTNRGAGGFGSTGH